MSLQRIIPFGSSWLQHHSDPPHHRLDGKQIESSHVLFLGASQMCKTSLLFQAAVSYVSEGCHVTFICKEPLSRMPLMVHGMPRTDPAKARLLKFLYVASTSELVDYLASLHELPVLPDIIIVDDLHVYTTQPQADSPEKTIAKLCSLLIDAKNFIELKKKPGETTGVLAAASETNPLNISVYNRYFKNCYQIQKTIPSGDEQHEMNPVGQDHTEKHTVRFHVREQIYMKDVMAQKIS